MDTDSRAAKFRELHERCFVVPNPWDAGSARFLASLGFEALASTSAGLAFAFGRDDHPNALSLDEVLANARSIVDATPLPVSADFQAGYGASPEDVRDNVASCVATGVAGVSIEDASGDPEAPLFDRGQALERLAAAREAIEASGRDVVLTARAECFLVDHPRPLEASLERLVAYAEAGADCLFAPGVRTPEQVSAVVEAVAPKPVNVIACDPTWMTVERLAELGVRRISVGSAFARVAWHGFMKSARDVAEHGSFASLAHAEPFETFAGLFPVRDEDGRNRG